MGEIGGNAGELEKKWGGMDKYVVVAEEASRVATVAHILSGDACAPSNQAKMAYTVLGVQAGGEVQWGSGVLDVHSTPVSASRDVPVIVGITLEPQAASPELVLRFMKRSRTLRTFVRRSQPNLLLALRATMAYLIAILDSVAKGSALPPSVISDLQIPMNDVLCSLLLLPRDIAVDVLHTPMTWGGWGSVWLPVRCELNFLSGFLSSKPVFQGLPHNPAKPLEVGTNVPTLGSKKGWKDAFFQALSRLTLCGA